MRTIPTFPFPHSALRLHSQIFHCPGCDKENCLWYAHATCHSVCKGTICGAPIVGQQPSTYWRRTNPGGHPHFHRTNRRSSQGQYLPRPLPLQHRESALPDSCKGCCVQSRWPHTDLENPNHRSPPRPEQSCTDYCFRLDRWHWSRPQSIPFHRC